MPHKNPFIIKTGMPYFDDMIANREYFFREKGKVYKVVFMSPKKYLDLCYEFQGTFYVDKYASEKIDKYAALLKQGVDFHCPMIERDGRFSSQEGRHRAVAAMRIGMKKIPVLMVRNRRKNDVLDPQYIGGDRSSPYAKGLS